MADLTKTIDDLNLRAELESYEGCPANIEDIRVWIEEKMRLRAFLPVPIVPFNTGFTEPGPEGRTSPWLRYDEEARPMGIYAWSIISLAWVRTGVVGEMLTVLRTEGTVEKDRDVKGLLGGWELADGTLGTPDHTTYPSDFDGSAPDWDLYTVIRI